MEAPEDDAPEDDAQERAHFQSIIRAYDEYAAWATAKVDRLESHYHKLATHDQELLSLATKVEAMRKAIRQNAIVLNMIVDPHRGHVGAAEEQLSTRVRRVPLADMDKMQSTLKQFVREWSVEGSIEREAAHRPLLDALQRAVPSSALRGVRVLLPGAGLGRLAWEVAMLGYQAQASEFSYFMLLASNFILNRLQPLGCVTVHPWVLQSCNVKSREDQMRGIKVPDVAPWSLPPAANLSMCAGDFLEVYGNQSNCWESVATCFFIDTAHDVATYIRLIRQLLVVGGAWVNLGPLLWHFSDDPHEVSIDLTWEELRVLIQDAGFLIEHESWHRCPYVRNPRSMYLMEYDAICFVARWRG